MIACKTLPCGIRIVYEKISYVKSASVGIWVAAGSRLETKETNGISHFTEHMLFKGTQSRSAQSIAEEMDIVGGYLNAFTSRECTCYYAKVIDENLDLAIDILSDMYKNSVFTEKDIELERRVILEEISMYEDSPEDVALDVLGKAAWGADSLGFPVSGTQESVERVDRKALIDFTSRYYTAENTVIAVAGNFDEERLFDSLCRSFEGIKHGAKSYVNYEKPQFTGNSLARKKDIEQTHIAIGFEGTAAGSDEVYTEAVLSNILGAAMSSRLFRKVREEKGLAYSIYSAPESYCKTGIFYIYAALSAENTDKVKEIIFDEIDGLLKDSVTESELIKGKGQLRGSYIMSLEGISQRMNALGKPYVLGERIKTPDEILRGIDAVDAEKIKLFTHKIFSGKAAQSIVTNTDL